MVQSGAFSYYLSFHVEGQNTDGGLKTEIRLRAQLSAIVKRESGLTEGEMLCVLVASLARCEARLK